jgi:N-acetyl-gamma-glutamyl-phosphate reductase
MATTIMLHNSMLNNKLTAAQIRDALYNYYAAERFVTVAPLGGDESVIYASTLAGTNDLRIIVCGNEEHTTVTALFDNLGKGASGAAVQNMNIMLGLDEGTGI